MPRDLLRSQRLRRVNHQGDALRLGMNWTEEDLGKPQVLQPSTFAGQHRTAGDRSSVMWTGAQAARSIEE